MVNREAQIRFTLGFKEFQVTALVADIVDEVILGLDVMIQYTFVVDIKKRLLKVKNAEILGVPSLESPQTSDCPNKRHNPTEL